MNFFYVKIACDKLSKIILLSLQLFGNGCKLFLTRNRSGKRSIKE